MDTGIDMMIGGTTDRGATRRVEARHRDDEGARVMAVGHRPRGGEITVREVAVEVGDEARAMGVTEIEAGVGVEVGGERKECEKKADCKCAVLLKVDLKRTCRGRQPTSLFRVSPLALGVNAQYAKRAEQTDKTCNALQRPACALMLLEQYEQDRTAIWKLYYRPDRAHTLHRVEHAIAEEKHSSIFVL